jgi:hypothetical protein
MTVNSAPLRKIIETEKRKNSAISGCGGFSRIAQLPVLDLGAGTASRLIIILLLLAVMGGRK